MVNYKKLLYVSLAITILIFLAGLLLGLNLDNTKVSDLADTLNQNELDRDSYLVEQDFIKNVGGSICDLSTSRINVLSSELAKLGQLLTKYESAGIIQASDYNYLKRKYFLLEIKTYTLFTNLKKDCNYNFDTILFFYDPGDQVSINQGYILDALVISRENLSIFSFDKTFDEPALETVKLHYNVTRSPSLIINNELKKEGLIQLDELKNILKENKY